MKITLAQQCREAADNLPENGRLDAQRLLRIAATEIERLEKELSKKNEMVNQEFSEDCGPLSHWKED